jgi:hypothetical protein
MALFITNLNISQSRFQVKPQYNIAAILYLQPSLHQFITTKLRFYHNS